MSTTSPSRIVVIGHTDVGRRACALPGERGVRTVHLSDPSDAELRSALSGPVDGVAVLLHDDMRALRYSLVVEHIRPGIRLLVAMFDGTARAQLERTVPNCVVLSPASIAVPSMVAAAIAPDHVSVRRRSTSRDRSWVTVDGTAESDAASVHAFQLPTGLRLRRVSSTTCCPGGTSHSSGVAYCAAPACTARWLSSQPGARNGTTSRWPSRHRPWRRTRRS